MADFKDHYKSKPDEEGIHPHPLFFSPSLGRWAVFAGDRVMAVIAASNRPTHQALENKQTVYWGKFVQTSNPSVPTMFAFDSEDYNERHVCLLVSMKCTAGKTVVVEAGTDGLFTEEMLGDLLATDPHINREF